MSNRPIWPTQPIHDAASVPLSSQPGTLPNMADTVAGWFQLLVFEKVVKIVDATFQVQETTVPVRFQGVVMTDPKRTLVKTSQGQRRWKVKTVWTWPGVPLSPDDVVLYESTQYRIGATIDYKQYGIFGYELLEDYTGSGPIGGE